MARRFIPCAFLQLAFVSTVVASDPPTTAILRYDGIYISAPAASDNISGGKADLYCSYLRFYPNGTVISVTSVCDQSSLQKIKNWFSIETAEKENSGLSSGKVQITGNQISFIAGSSFGDVSYKGGVVNGRIYLDTHSYINNHRGHKFYSFVKW